MGSTVTPAHVFFVSFAKFLIATFFITPNFWTVLFPETLSQVLRQAPGTRSIWNYVNERNLISGESTCVRASFFNEKKTLVLLISSEFFKFLITFFTEHLWKTEKLCKLNSVCKFNSFMTEAVIYKNQSID